LWEAATGREVLRQIVECSLVDRGVFAPDGRLLATAFSADLWDLHGGRLRPLDDRAPWGTPLAFSLDGRLLARTEPDSFRGPPREVGVYEVLTGRALARLEIPEGYCAAAAFTPQGRTLVVAGTDALQVWEPSTGRVLLRLDARGRLNHWTPAGFATCLAVAPDGRTAATGHADGTVLLWDLAPNQDRLAQPAGIPKKPEACWKDLAELDPTAAYAAIDGLAAMPAEALALLRGRLRPVVVESRWLAGRIAELNSPDFATREAASRALEEVAEAAEEELRQALAKTAFPEGRRRLGAVLASPRPAELSPEMLRQLRALTVLERIGSNEAGDVLRRLAGGAGGATLTREAKAALDRLARGRPAGPSAGLNPDRR
jgi:hypothetical protein